MAAKLRSTPTGATVPSDQAVIGAGGERRAHRRAERAPADAPAAARRSVQRLNRAAPQSAAAESQPPRSSDRPGIDQQHREAGGREQLVGPHLPLANAAAGEHQRERRRPGGRRGPAEERHVGVLTTAATISAGSRREPEQPRQQEDPAADEPDVEAGDGQQVHQAGLGEAILQLGIDATSAAQHQRVDQRRAGAVELATGAGDDGPEPLRQRRGARAAGPPPTTRASRRRGPRYRRAGSSCPRSGSSMPGVDAGRRRASGRPPRRCTRHRSG